MTLLRFKTHNDSNIDVNGTSHQGEISETFENLLKVFGTPMGASDDNKVDVEWNIMFNDGVVATIYNWKTVLQVWEQMALIQLITKHGTLVEKL